MTNLFIFSKSVNKYSILGLTISLHWSDCAMDVEKEDLYQELDIMRKISHHPNIVDYLGCCTQQGK